MTSDQYQQPAKKRKPAATRILVFLAICFFSSLGFRIIETMFTASNQISWRSEVHAQENQKEADSAPRETEDAINKMESEKMALNTKNTDMPESFEALPLTSPGCDPSVLITALQAQERDLQERALRLQSREQQLEVAETRIKKRLGAMEIAKADLEATIAKVEQAAQKDIQHLVAMYSKMKPKQAGEIFNTMEPAFAAGFMGEMKADTAAAILSNMDYQKAHAVSVVMVGRNANAPTD